MFIFVRTLSHCSINEGESNLWRKIDDRNRIFSSLSFSKPKVPAVLLLANSLYENNTSANKYSGGITIIFRRHNFSASHAIAGLFAIPVNSWQLEELVYTDVTLIPGLTTIKWWFSNGYSYDQIPKQSQLVYLIHFAQLSMLITSAENPSHFYHLSSFSNQAC